MSQQRHFSFCTVVYLTRTISEVNLNIKAGKVHKVHIKLLTCSCVKNEIRKSRSFKGEIPEYICVFHAIFALTSVKAIKHFHSFSSHKYLSRYL